MKYKGDLEGFPQEVAEPVKEPIKIKRSDILEKFGCDDFEIVE